VAVQLVVATDGAEALALGMAIEGATPGSIVVNRTPSSPIFSSVLALHFSRDVEDTTGGVRSFGALGTRAGIESEPKPRHRVLILR
jgi:hypothetical protein